MGHRKRKKFIAINAYTKQQEKSQINNLPLQLKERARKNKLNPKLAEGRE